MTRTIRRSREDAIMRRLVLALVVLTFAASADAQNERSPPMCLRSIDIDHTKTPNNHTILFFMKDGKVWSGTLRSDCPELTFSGFEYGPTPRDGICANIQTIRVLKSGAICEIGPLVPAVP
jgi:hypothetical protein